MHKFINLTAAAIMLVSSAPVLARDRAASKSANLAPIAHRYIWYYDVRDDVRDFPTNGFFPGNFAANPANATISAAGFFGSWPSRAPNVSPSHVVVGSKRAQTHCARRNRACGNHGMQGQR
jgi:hypothetical protein